MNSTQSERRRQCDSREPVDSHQQQLIEWIAAIAGHDERALMALYDATQFRVLGLVSRIIHQQVLVEETVEEIYFQVWRQAARFDPARGHPMGWLLSMARARALDTIRREARHNHVKVDPEGGLELVSDGPQCDELLAATRNRADLHNALLLLNDQPRQLVAMAFFKGMSHEEIATQMSLPLGTVKSQIRRALIKLREVLGEAMSIEMPS